MAKVAKDEEDDDQDAGQDPAKGASGKGKAKAVNDLVNGVFTETSPITALIKHTGKVTVYTDEEAGSLVKEYNKKF